jgi:hypothetical protein
MKLTAAKRSKIPASEFAGPGRSFPIPDKSHARFAISAASRSENAGNISPAEAASIKAKARSKLGPGSAPDMAKHNKTVKAIFDGKE